MWASRRYVDVERIRRRAGETFDRSFYPAGRPRQLAAIYASGDRTAALNQLDVPTLVIHGRDDTLITPAEGWRPPKRSLGAHLLVADMGHDLPPQLWPLIVSAIVAISESSGTCWVDDLRKRHLSPGYRIVEIAGIGPGPFAAMMLADMGAEVIRGGAGAGDAGPRPDRRTSTSRCGVGATSPSISSIPMASAVLLDLVERADALIEGFRPGVMERLGLGPTSVSPATRSSCTDG